MSELAATLAKTEPGVTNMSELAATLAKLSHVKFLKRCLLTKMSELADTLLNPGGDTG